MGNRERAKTKLQEFVTYREIGIGGDNEDDE